MKRQIIAMMVCGAVLAASALATSNTDYSKWTTATLQQKRIELYKQLPQVGNRKHVAAYSKHGQPLPQEDEIRLIEQELDKRKSAGDKAAYYEPAAPSIYKHKQPFG
jgi:hypothetical protein